MTRSSLLTQIISIFSIWTVFWKIRNCDAVSLLQPFKNSNWKNKLSTWRRSFEPCWVDNVLLTRLHRHRKSSFFVKLTGAITWLKHHFREKYFWAFYTTDNCRNVYNLPMCQFCCIVYLVQACRNNLQKLFGCGSSSFDKLRNRLLWTIITTALSVADIMSCS